MTYGAIKPGERFVFLTAPNSPCVKRKDGWYNCPDRKMEGIAADGVPVEKIEEAAKV